LSHDEGPLPASQRPTFFDIVCGLNDEAMLRMTDFDMDTRAGHFPQKIKVDGVILPDIHRVNAGR
jgi:hypothetical protein